MPERKSRAAAVFTLGVLCLLSTVLLVGGGCSKKENGPTERTIAKSGPPAYKPYLNSDLILV